MIGNGIVGTLEDADGGFLDGLPNDNAIGDLARPKKDIGENARRGYWRLIPLVRVYRRRQV